MSILLQEKVFVSYNGYQILIWLSVNRPCQWVYRKLHSKFYLCRNRQVRCVWRHLVCSRSAAPTICPNWRERVGQSRIDCQDTVITLIYVDSTIKSTNLLISNYFAMLSVTMVTYWQESCRWWYWTWGRSPYCCAPRSWSSTWCLGWAPSRWWTVSPPTPPPPPTHGHSGSGQSCRTAGNLATEVSQGHWRSMVIIKVKGHRLMAIMKVKGHWKI